MHCFFNPQGGVKMSKTEASTSGVFDCNGLIEQWRALSCESKSSNPCPEKNQSNLIKNVRDS